MITSKMQERATAYTDAGTWKCSWHWKRTSSGSVTLDGARQMLHDLKCEGSEGVEMLEEIQQIRDRYKLADEIREVIALMEADL